jgi:aspartokinase-like uncharacterized kinase
MTPTRVVKLGGSLLDYDGLVPAVRNWLDAQPPMRTVAVVGGGDMADVVRASFRRHVLSEEAAHWLCIRILGVTAELVAGLLPEARLTRRLEELETMPARGLAIFEPEEFLRNEAEILSRRGMKVPPLPHSWDVTSDSIAARLAALLGAEELVLLKSALPDGILGLQEAAGAGYVDRYFPCAAAGLPRVRFVNLRAEGYPSLDVVASPLGGRWA